MTLGTLPATTLVRLGDRAAALLSPAGKVGIVRGYGRAGRTRGDQLRRMLAARGLSTVDIPPVLRRRNALADLRRFAGDVELLIDVTRRDGDGHRLAALLGCPLLTDREEGPEPVRAVIGMTEGEELVDAALTTVALRPLGDDARLALRVDGRAVEPAAGATVVVSLEAGTGRLRCTVAGEDSADAEQIVVRPSAGTYVIVRDGQPVADLTDAVHLAAVVRPLTVTAPSTGPELAEELAG
ncbi:hypothetical protein [Thermomonospora cellulosilytica]|uniref:Uncharacterized protein n=1 Tax=Thermomonospora cellulosilytica TaxID=1411118 RepID=A0A7W3MTH5_9ACTN|nr:hypothetical protein [Thermomonospora cellulosilytica]MBA9001594.1 hypothetical protein [Thermomonospora cellulosilytica]